MWCGYSDTPLTVTLLPFPEGVTVSGHICITYLKSILVASNHLKQVDL